MQNFYQEVIEKDAENHIFCSTNLLDTSNVEISRNNSNFSFYDPSDLIENNLKA
jgi:hypothetical protein